jgi:hypothetical protein
MKSWILTLPNIGNSEITIKNVQIWGNYKKDVWKFPANTGHASTTPVVFENSIVKLSSNVDGSSQTFSAIIKYKSKNGKNIENKVYASSLELLNT